MTLLTRRVAFPTDGAARHLLRLLLAMLALLVCAVIHLGLGARHIGPLTLFHALYAFDEHNFNHRVIVDLRLARLLAALLAGGALGMAGTLLQSIIRNPLGEPHILGLNAGAALAVVACSSLGVSWNGAFFARPLIAAGGAATLFALVMALAGAGRAGLTPLKVTLCGVAVSSFAASITAAILLFDESTLLALRTWLAGDLAGIGYPALGHAVAPALIGALAALFIAPGLNILALGDTVAAGLGVGIARLRLFGLLATALLCGAAVSVAGPIGFIGLVAPHITRRLVGEDLRIGLPLGAICGALLLLTADIAARTLIAPRELATGLMTALAGAPLFVYISARCFR